MAGMNKGLGQPDDGADDAAGRPARALGQPDSAFDLWLRRGLHQMFDAVANEPIPDELLKLIEEDRQK